MHLTDPISPYSALHQIQRRDRFSAREPFVLFATVIASCSKQGTYIPSPHNKAEPTFYQLLYEPGQSKLFFLHLVYHVVILGMFALIFGKKETLTSMYT